MRILYIDCDSLRPDHLGCYGYHRDTSPNVDALAAAGRRFTNCYASDGPCGPSRTALFSARFGIHTGVVNHGGLAADPRRHGHNRGFSYPSQYDSWMKALVDAGYHTALVSPFPMRHDAWQVVEGFRELHDTGDDGHETAEAVYPFAERWLDDHATEDDWYLHVNFWDPHADYDVPESYGEPFADDPAPEWLTEERIADQREGYGPHCAREPHPSYWERPLDEYLVDHPRMPEEISSREDFRQWIDGYDTAIRYMDEYVGKLVEQLREAGVFEDTLVIVSADHAENLGELNVYGDHRTCNDTVANVPLILSGPGVEPGVDEDLHYQLDLPPTVVDLAGGDVPEGWDGRAFTPAVTGDASAGRDALVVSHGFGSCQRGVRWDEWFLLRTYHDGCNGQLEETMLFDVEADPHETTNLAGERPEVVERGLAILQRWHDDRMVEAGTGANGGNPDTPDGVTDPMWEVLREGGPQPVRDGLGTYVERLRETGREDHADRLAAAYRD